MLSTEQVEPLRHLEILNEIARIANLDLSLQPMLQRITDILHQKFGWPFVACVSLDPAGGRFVCEAVSTCLPTMIRPGYSRPLGSGVVGEVAATGRPILIDDVRTAANYVETAAGIRSELCVPVRHGDHTVAILNLESHRLADFHGELPLLETIAEQIGGVIASARLYEEVDRRARLLATVNEVSRAALEAGELELLLDQSVGTIHRRLGVALAAIILVDREHGEFELAAQAGTIQLAAPRGARWPLRAGLVGRAVRTGEPQLALDVHADSDYVSLNDSVTSEYSVPIRWRENLLGVLDLESTTPAAFSPDNLAVYRTIAGQLAGAIHLAAINRRLEDANERLREANERLERLSALDGLTGIANRRSFDEALAREWRRAARSHEPLSLVLIDIDEFKRYNDSQGHQRGDDCLRQVAACLAGKLARASDHVARYGGEELVALLPGTDAAAAEGIAEALREAVEALALPHEESSVTGVVTVSLGVATAPARPGTTPESLVEAADRALYRAKREGRNRVRSEPVDPDPSGEAPTAVGSPALEG